MAQGFPVGLSSWPTTKPTGPRTAPSSDLQAQSKRNQALRSRRGCSKNCAGTKEIRGVEEQYACAGLSCYPPQRWRVGVPKSACLALLSLPRSSDPKFCFFEAPPLCFACQGARVRRSCLAFAFNTKAVQFSPPLRSRRYLPSEAAQTNLSRLDGVKLLAGGDDLFLSVPTLRLSPFPGSHVCAGMIGHSALV